MSENSLLNLIISKKFNIIKERIKEEDWNKELSFLLCSIEPRKMDIVPKKYLTTDLISFYLDKVTELKEGKFDIDDLPILSDRILDENKDGNIMITLVTANINELESVDYKYKTYKFYRFLLASYGIKGDIEAVFKRLIPDIPKDFLDYGMYGAIINIYMEEMEVYKRRQERNPYGARELLTFNESLNLPEYILTPSFLTLLAETILEERDDMCLVGPYINPLYLKDGRLTKLMVNFIPNYEENKNFLLCLSPRDIMLEDIIKYYKLLGDDNPNFKAFVFITEYHMARFITVDTILKSLEEYPEATIDRIIYFKKKGINIFDIIMLRNEDISNLVDKFIEYSDEKRFLSLLCIKDIRVSLTNEQRMVVADKFILLSGTKFKEKIKNKNNHEYIISLMISVLDNVSPFIKDICIVNNGYEHSIKSIYEFFKGNYNYLNNSIKELFENNSYKDIELRVLFK